MNITQTHEEKWSKDGTHYNKGYKVEKNFFKDFIEDIKQKNTDGYKRYQWHVQKYGKTIEKGIVLYTSLTTIKEFETYAFRKGVKINTQNNDQNMYVILI